MGFRQCLDIPKLLEWFTAAAGPHKASLVPPLIPIKKSLESWWAAAPQAMKWQQWEPHLAGIWAEMELSGTKFHVFHSKHSLFYLCPPRGAGRELPGDWRVWTWAGQLGQNPWCCLDWEPGLCCCRGHSTLCNHPAEILCSLFLPRQEKKKNPGLKLNQQNHPEKKKIHVFIVID